MKRLLVLAARMLATPIAAQMPDPTGDASDAEVQAAIAKMAAGLTGSRIEDGRIEDRRIEDGATRTLKVGEVMLIPAGTPHWFGVTGGKLMLLGMKVSHL